MTGRNFRASLAVLAIHSGYLCALAAALECDETLYNYRGCQNQTISGKGCQLWSSQSPHVHDKSDDKYPNEGLGDHNYCRNPDHDSGGIWCYTTEFAPRWEYCKPISGCTMEEGSHWKGPSEDDQLVKGITSISASACSQTCSYYPDCDYWVFAKNTSKCFLKKGPVDVNAPPRVDVDVTSGHKCTPVCERPSGCEAPADLYQSFDCDGDGTLDHVCTDTVTNKRYAALSSVGCPSAFSSIASGRCVSDYFTRTENVMLAGNGTVSESLRGSPDECKRTCHARDWCTSFDYQAVSKECQLSNSDPVALQTGVVGSDHYTITRPVGCASGYSSYPGSMGAVDGAPAAERVASCQVCAGWCSGDTNCLSYECSPSELQCHLHPVPAPTQAPQGDYVFCVKGRITDGGCRDDPHYRLHNEGLGSVGWQHAYKCSDIQAFLLEFGVGCSASAAFFAERGLGDLWRPRDQDEALAHCPLSCGLCEHTYEYMGCYNDVRKNGCRAMSMADCEDPTYLNTGSTPAEFALNCADLCARKGALFMGLQDVNYCRCGNTYAHAGGSFMCGHLDGDGVAANCGAGSVWAGLPGGGGTSHATPQCQLRNAVYRIVNTTDCFSDGYLTDYIRPATNSSTVALHPNIFSATACQKLCQADYECHHFGWHATDHVCDLLAKPIAKYSFTPDAAYKSGPKSCGCHPGCATCAPPADCAPCAGDTMHECTSCVDGKPIIFDWDEDGIGRCNLTFIPGLEQELLRDKLPMPQNTIGCYDDLTTVIRIPELDEELGCKDMIPFLEQEWLSGTAAERNLYLVPRCKDVLDNLSKRNFPDSFLASIHSALATAMVQCPASCLMCGTSAEYLATTMPPTSPTVDPNPSPPPVSSLWFSADILEEIGGDGNGDGGGQLSIFLGGGFGILGLSLVAGCLFLRFKKKPLDSGSTEGGLLTEPGPFSLFRSFFTGRAFGRAPSSSSSNPSDRQSVASSSLGQGGWELIQDDQLQFLGLLGEGGAGQVYKAKWRSNIVAVKVLNSRGMRHPVRTWNDWQEMDALSQCRHPNVLAFYGLVVIGDPSADSSSSNTESRPLKNDGNPQKNAWSVRDYRDITSVYIVTELAQHSLLQALHTPSFQSYSPQERLAIAIGIASGLEYLHQRPTPIFHMDFKPGNVLMKGEMLPCIGDLGSAVLGKTHLSAQEFKDVAVTDGYIAPELRNSGQMIDLMAVDVFTYGLVLMNLFSDGPLDHGLLARDQRTRMYKGITCPTRHQLVLRLLQQTPESVIELILSLTALEPHTRPSMMKVGDTLQEALHKIEQDKTQHEAPANLNAPKQPIPPATTPLPSSPSLSSNAASDPHTFATAPSTPPSSVPASFTTGPTNSDLLVSTTVSIRFPQSVDLASDAPSSTAAREMAGIPVSMLWSEALEHIEHPRDLELYEET